MVCTRCKELYLLCREGITTLVKGIYPNNAKWLIHLAAIISTSLALCPYIHADTLIESVLKIASYTTTLTTGLVFIFNKWLWKWMPEFITGLPNLNGTWKGDLKYRWINPDTKIDGKDTVKPVFLVIKQTFLSIRICIFSVESESYSLSANISPTETGSWELSYNYDNTPDRSFRDRSQRHRGSAELKASKVNTAHQLKGDYWTDRWSQGNMEFLERKHKYATNYKSALDIFSEDQSTA
jgi:hypothetical protein